SAKSLFMRKILLAVLVILSTEFAVAQPSAVPGRVEYQKGYKSAALLELPYAPDIVEAAIKDYMLKKGIKEQKIKGFQTFKGARMTDTDGELADLYFKVERKSRKENNMSSVYLIVGRPNENVSLRPLEDSYRVDDGRSFLEEIIPSIDAYNLEVMIKKQDDVVKKEEKKLKNLIDNQRDMEDKIRNLEEKLAQNKRDQEEQSANLTRQREAKQAM